MRGRCNQLRCIAVEGVNGPQGRCPHAQIRDLTECGRAHCSVGCTLRLSAADLTFALQRPRPLFDVGHTVRRQADHARRPQRQTRQVCTRSLCQIACQQLLRVDHPHTDRAPERQTGPPRCDECQITDAKCTSFWHILSTRSESIRWDCACGFFFAVRLFAKTRWASKQLYAPSPRSAHGC